MQGFTSKTVACTSVFLIYTHFQDWSWNPTKASGDRVELFTQSDANLKQCAVSFSPDINSSDEDLQHPHLKITLCGAVLVHLVFSPSAFQEKHF